MEMNKKPVKTPEDLFELLDNVKAAKQVARVLRRTTPTPVEIANEVWNSFNWTDARGVYGKAEDS
jgi:hypothetical protein